MEIERKFLVKNDHYKINAKKVLFRQGYLSIDSERTVRIRRFGDKAFLTIKGKTESFSREEFEYSIPVKDADFMLDNLCITPIIEKVRCFLNYEGSDWVIDEFLGENKGLIVAEIELDSESQNFITPDWLGEEVTFDTRYFNSNLVKKPFKNW